MQHKESSKATDEMVIHALPEYMLLTSSNGRPSRELALRVVHAR